MTNENTNNKENPSELEKIAGADIQKQYYSLLFESESLMEAVKLKLDSGICLDKKIAREFERRLSPHLGYEYVTYTGALLCFLTGQASAKEFVHSYFTHPHAGIANVLFEKICEGEIK